MMAAASRVFITGASSGIGMALAQHYAQQGARLGLVARRSDALAALVASLPLSPEGAHQIYAVDVTDAIALRAAAHAFMALVGTPDVVIANAGISWGTSTEEAGDLEMFQRIIDTNLIATVATFQPFIVPMKQLKKARLVGIGSVAGIRGLPGAAAYSASKAATISFCESLRVELRGSAIRVVTIAPGYIDMPMTADNPYPMPFLMPVNAFARRALQAIDRGTSYQIIPWQMGWVAKVLRLLPNWAYDRAAGRARRKPRFNGTGL